MSDQRNSCRLKLLFQSLPGQCSLFLQISPFICRATYGGLVLPARIILPSSTMFSSLGRHRSVRVQMPIQSSPKHPRLRGRESPRLRVGGNTLARSSHWPSELLLLLSGASISRGPAEPGCCVLSNCRRDRKGAASPGPEQGQQRTSLECLPLTLV